MKKVLSLILAAMITLTLGMAGAEDLGVQIIGGDETAVESLYLEDAQIGASYRIDGYAIVNLLSFDYYDCFAQYDKDCSGNNDHASNSGLGASAVYWDNGSWFHQHAHWNDSGTNADFAWLLVDLVNLQKKDIAFIKDISVKVIYDDEYEFAGWVRQFNHDYRTTIFRKDYDGKYYIVETADKNYLSDYALDPANEEPIGQMYTGSYVFGCTLPNYVVEGKESLRMEIKLGSSEMTYHIRK